MWLLCNTMYYISGKPCITSTTSGISAFAHARIHVHVCIVACSYDFQGAAK